jgi:RHS repeat-associated protein
VLRDKNTDSDDVCNNERLYFANDANMNVTALMGTDGTPLERYVYDPYGKVTIYDDDWSETREESSYDNRILFAGYYFDNETGLYHVRNRYYHPYFGLITRDPGGYVDGMSLYEYCRGGPVGATDAMGLGLIEPGDSGWDPPQSTPLPPDPRTVLEIKSESRPRGNPST